MSHVLHRSLLNDPVLALSGEGAYLYDHTGKRYLDACGGAAVSILGHNNPAVADAIKNQLQKLAYAHSSFFSTPVLEELADHLTSKAPGMNRVAFVSGGSEANEAALKLARQYFVEKGEAERSLFIARHQSYHGNTLGALAVGGNEWRRRAFKPLLIDAHHISACYEYRLKQANESRTDYGLRAANELEGMIQQLGPERVAGFIAEPVVGATLGAVPAVAGYFQRIREICDRYGVLLILDEVMCGAGRTGTLFAYEQEQIIPDIVTLAKGLAAGYQPIGAMLCRENIVDTIRSGSGFFQHGHTFMGHATAAAAALATLKVVQEQNLLLQVSERGASLQALLENALLSHPHVGDIRGRGLFLGVELVADPGSRKPFSPDLKIHARIKETAMAEGLLCYPMGGTLDGRSGDHILLAPPFIVSESQLQTIADTLKKVIDEVTRNAPT